LEIVLEAAELLALDGVEAEGLPAMVSLLKEYIFSMALGGVSSAEINMDFGKMKEMGAHM
jgi:hypothetical protein